MNPRIFSVVLACLTLAGAAAVSAETAQPGATEDLGVPGSFTFANVVRRANELAQSPYEPDRPALPEFFANLNYDQYRDIRFRKEASLWRDQALPFQAQFFSRGFLYKDRVTINVIENGQVVPVEFMNDLFDYGKNELPTEVPHDMGFAGFRLHYPLNRDDLLDEVVVFQGASYFRAVGQGLNYGITARGLAIDTGLPSSEEFPIFREFWIEKPGKDATEITVYALLDSESVAGAYRFVIKPGLQTIMDVKAHLTFRKTVQKIGIAPLTSMFFHGENTDRFMDNFRPEVHDSDGLLVETGSGERIWRPLLNPLGLRVNRFQVENPRSFGLFQRDRDYNQYQDLEAHYQNRPSLLVEPLGAWGHGAVELVEIPSNAERYDNIVAFWVPDREIAPEEQWDFEYRLRFATDPEGRLTGGRTVSTRIGAGGNDIPDPSRRKFVLDFAGESLAALPTDTPVEAVVTASSGELSIPVVQSNPAVKGWRLFFELTPDGNQPVDLRAFLRQGDDVLSETWSYQWVRE